MKIDCHPTLQVSAAEILDFAADGIIGTDESGCILIFNRAAEVMFGYDAQEVLGQSVEKLMPERFRSGHAVEVRAFSADTESAGHIMGHSREVFGMTKGGGEFPVEATVSRRSLGGHFVLTVVLRDLSERKRLLRELEARNRALEESESRLRLALKGGQMGAWDWDLISNRLLMDSCARRLWGFPEHAVLSADCAFERVHSDDLPHLEDALRRATENGREFRREFRIVRPDGATVWTCGKALVLRGAEGAAAKMIGVTFDVTDRQKIEEQRQLLSGELVHRIKNMMSLVNAVVSMTARTAASVEDYKVSLQGRLGAITKSHAALFESGWTCLRLREQLEAELHPYCHGAGGNVVLDGPDCDLPPQLGLSLGLVIHELATNAAKYGALSVPAGRVEVKWVVREESPRRLVLEWREEGGPPVSPPSREGFGTSLVTRSLDLSGGGDVEFDYRPEGLRCQMLLSLGESGRKQIAEEGGVS